MRDRVERIILGSALWLLMFNAFITFLRSGFSTKTLAYVGLSFGILMTLAIIRASSVWPALVLASLVFSFAPPVVLLNRVEIGMAIIVAIGLVFIVRSTLVPPASGRIFAAAETWFMLISVLIVIARFAKDRPGSTFLGEVGGAGEAAIYLLGGLAYFLAALVFAGDWNVQKNATLVMKLAIVAAVAQIAFAIFRTEAFVLYMGAIFSRQLWLLLPLLIAWFSEREASGSRAAGGLFRWSALFSWVTILLGVSTPFRSRPFFAVGIIVGVASRYRRLRRAVTALTVGGLIGLAVLLVVGTERLAPRTARSLSTLVHVDEMRVFSFARQFGTSSEIGWISEFRREMWLLARDHIRQHPWFGKGFIVSRAELGFALTGEYDFRRATQSLALAGGYHNAVLALAVFAGIPCALAFACAMLLGLWRFYRMTRRTKITESRLLEAAVLGFFLPSAGQMLMNGMGRHFYVVCVLLGVMRGMCVHNARMRLLHSREVAAPAAREMEPEQTLLVP